MRAVIQMDLDREVFVGGVTHGLDGKVEGFTMDEDTEDLFFGKEGGGVNFFRFEHATNEHETIYRRQFYVADLPTKGSIYLNSQEAQLWEAVVFFNPVDGNRFGRDATLGINILPEFSDEFFLGHEYEGNFGDVIGRIPTGEIGVFIDELGQRRPNRWAQTLRNSGGAKTVEVFLNSTNNDPVIAEQEIEDLRGFYWASAPQGTQRIIARVRAETASVHFVDIVGYVRFRQYACPIVEEV